MHIKWKSFGKDKYPPPPIVVRSHKICPKLKFVYIILPRIILTTNLYEISTYNLCISKNTEPFFEISLILGEILENLSIGIWSIFNCAYLYHTHLYIRPFLYSPT